MLLFTYQVCFNLDVNLYQKSWLAKMAAMRGGAIMRAMIKNPGMRQVVYNTPQAGLFTPKFGQTSDILKATLVNQWNDVGRNALAKNLRLFRAGKPIPPLPASPMSLLNQRGRA